MPTTVTVGQRREIVTNVRHAAKVRLYDAESRVCGYALTNAVGRGMNVSLRYDGSYLTNMVYALPNGSRFAVNLTRKNSRKELVTCRDYSFGTQPVYWYSTGYDLIGCPTNATDSVSLMREWLYNNRSELVGATVGADRYGYAYDTIGNRLWSAANAVTNSYTANSLNQYTAVSTATNLVYDADGNMTGDGAYIYSYDAENRLRSVTARPATSGAIRVLNAYDHRNRRIRKTVQRLSVSVAQPPALPVEVREWQTVETHTFVWDGNNIVLEKVGFAGGATRTFEYFWGNDLSGSEDGAGGVGGLLAVSVDGAYCFPCYDNNGNITRYIGEDGSVVAQFVYDPYGSIIEQSGCFAELLAIRFSTKYTDLEVGLVSYLMRFYDPFNGRWLNRDPIEEEGGNNLYAFCLNNPIAIFDLLGLLTSSEAFEHYKSGPDDPNDSTKRTPIRISFDEINTSEVSVKDFPAVKKLLSERKPGKHKVTWKNKDDNLPFSTNGDQSLYLGNVSLKLEGTLEIKTDCTWKFDGTLKCFDDLYDFNASTHRSWFGEWLTSVGRKTPGKPFNIEIRGQKLISENGTYETKKKGWRLY